MLELIFDSRKNMLQVCGNVFLNFEILLTSLSYYGFSGPLWNISQSNIWTLWGRKNKQNRKADLYWRKQRAMRICKKKEHKRHKNLVHPCFTHMTCGCLCASS